MAVRKILDYSIDPDEMHTSTCGMIGIAQKSGKNYFCKQYNCPVEPADNGALSAKAIERNRAEFELFKKRKLRLNNTLREVCGKGGNVVYPLQETVYDHHWMEFTEYIDDKVPEDQYAKVVSGLDEKSKLLVLKTVMGALQTIHGQKIVHGDLKLANLVLVKNSSGNYVSKIIDFDGAFFEDDVPLDSITGTVDYYSPELAYYSCNEDREFREKASKMMTTKSDIFTMGLILHEYLAGEKPQPDHLTTSLQKAKDAGRFIYPWQIFFVNDKGETKPQLVISDKIKEPAYVALISDMLNFRPERRPSALDVMSRLTTKQLPIETDPWPEDSIIIEESKIKGSLVGLRKITISEKDKPDIHVYETIARDGRRYNKTAKELVADGFARMNTPAKEAPKGWLPPRAEDHIEWNLDQLKKVFTSICPDDRPGIYRATDRGGRTQYLTLTKLKMMNFAIEKSAPSKPAPKPGPTPVPLSAELWPEDKSRYQLDEAALSKYHLTFSGRAEQNGVKGYKIVMPNHTEQFWTSQKCKMMGIFKS